ncbi:MAG: SRPBCC family protein [Deltaproteobacteria bacterium]|nr:SRPBCC family protein [Deltaproteobacteria bacterium]
MNDHTLKLLATYRRTIQASLERIWENVLDWEHLPWLHRKSFAAIQLLEQTPEGWRAQATLRPAEAKREAVITIEMDMPNLRYWSRTVGGQGTGNGVLTCLSPVSQHVTDIKVEFYAPSSLSPDKAKVLGESYLRLYEQLWDEDERMMQHRQRSLDRGWKQGARPDSMPVEQERPRHA